MKNESELIKGCRAGEADARKRLYTLFAEQMLSVCYRYTGDMDAAHDVLHDAFIKIFTRFSYRGEASLKTWITRIMITQSIDYLRKQKHMEQWVTTGEFLPEVPDSAEIENSKGISNEKLMKFLAELPDGCRTVFNLYVFEEKSHKEIGELLGIKEHSSTSQLHRARQLLATKIKEYSNNEKEY